MDLAALKPSICRTRVKQHDGHILAGTGFLVSERYVVTCLHCLDDGADDHVMHLSVLFTDWPEQDQTREAKRVWIDLERDLAVLELVTPAPPGVKGLCLSETCKERQPCSSWGYAGPALEGQPLNGTIADPHYKVDSASIIAVQTSLARDPVKGLSGAPLIVGNFVVGVFSDQLSDPKLDVPRFETLYAVPVHHLRGAPGVRFDIERALDALTCSERSDRWLGSWRFSGPRGGVVWDMITTSTTPSQVVVGMTNPHGVYGSFDNGKTWTSMNHGLGCRGINAIAESPHDRSLFIATDRGVWRRDHETETWVELGRFSGKDTLCVVFSHHTSGVIIGTRTPGGCRVSVGIGLSFASGPSNFSDNSDVGHLHVSLDGARVWATLPFDTTINHAAFSPHDDSVLLACADAGLFRAEADFRSIKRFESFPGRPLHVVPCPDDPSFIMVGTLKGLYLSNDSGATWDLHSEIGEAQVSRIARHPVISNQLMASTSTGVFESSDAGRTWHRSVDTPAHAWSMTVAWGPDLTALVGTSGGAVYRKSPKNRFWTPSCSNLPPLAGLSLSQDPRGNIWTSTNGGIYSTHDRGESWQYRGLYRSAVYMLCFPRRSLAKDKDDAFIQGLHVSRDGGRTFVGAESSCNDFDIVARTEDDLLRSRDGGLTFSSVMPPPSLIPDADSVVWYDLVGNHHVVAAVQGTTTGRAIHDGLLWYVIPAEVAVDRGFRAAISNHGETVWVAPASGGLLRSCQGGPFQACTGLPDKPVCCFIDCLERKGCVLIAAIDGSVWRSDGTRHFVQLAPARQNDPHWACLALSPLGERMILGTSSGAFLSEDFGNSWKPVPGGLLSTEDAAHEDSYHVNFLLFATPPGSGCYAAMTAGIFRLFEQ